MEVQKKMTCTLKEDTPVVMMPPRTDANPKPNTPPQNSDAPERLPLMVSREEADVLLTVLVMTSFEDGTFDGAMERVLVRLVEVQRAFVRDDV